MTCYFIPYSFKNYLVSTYCVPVLCYILKTIVAVRIDRTSAFNGLAAQQGNRKLNKFKCCSLRVLGEQIAEEHNITWGGQGRILEVSFKLRPKGGQKKGRECSWQREKHVPDTEVRC